MSMSRLSSILSFAGFKVALLFGAAAQGSINFSDFHSCRLQKDGKSCIIDQRLDKFFETNPDLDFADPKFQRFIDEITTTHPANPFKFQSHELGGTSLEIIDTAERSYEVWTKLIDNAQYHVHLQVFIILYDTAHNGTVPLPCKGAPVDFERSEISCKLWQAAERGVKVRIITDSLGNINQLMGGAEKLITAMSQHPYIQVQNYNPIQAYHGARQILWDKFKIWLWSHNRMHSKQMVVDGTYAITGGRNIGSNYMKPKPESPSTDWGPRIYGQPDDPKYRDTEVYIKGRGVHEVQRQFLRNWLEFGEWERTISRNIRNWSIFDPRTWVRRYDCIQQVYYGIPYYCKENDARLGNFTSPDQLLNDREFFPELEWLGDEKLRLVESLPARAGEIPKNPFLKPDNQGSFSQVVASALPLPQASKKYQGLSLGELIYIAHIRNAKDRILITNPYLVLHKPIRNALLEALVFRGVDVQIFTNSYQSNDPGILWNCSAQDFATLLSNGARIFEFLSTHGMMHAKTALFDQDVAIVGSLNMDGWSFDSNLESLAILRGPKSTSQMEAEWNRDIANEMTREMTWEILMQSAAERGLDRNLTSRICRNFGVFL